MILPTQPVTLSTEEVEELARHFSSFRHDVNGCLSLIVAAAELIRFNPEVIKRMGPTLVEQPPKIAGKVLEFIEQCERALTIRSAADVSWYAGLWKRSTMVPGAPQVPQAIDPDEAKSLHGELMSLNKEMTQLGFTIAGARSLTAIDAANAAEVIPNIVDQFSKAALKFEQVASRIEHALEIADSGARRLGSGTPSGPVTLSPEQIELFHRRLLNLQRDVHEQIVPLLELSRLARHSPQELQARMAQFSAHPPKISAEVTEFGTSFDSTFQIQRAT